MLRSMRKEEGVECCNIEEDSRLVRPLSWEGRIFREIKSGQTVGLLLDCDDNMVLALKNCC